MQPDEKREGRNNRRERERERENIGKVKREGGRDNGICTGCVYK